MTQPFRYLDRRPKRAGEGVDFRLHAPEGYAEFKAYKPWLRDEFAFRCAYCLHRETWSDHGHSCFGIDHAKPKTTNPEAECLYENLFYACNRCNSAKGIEVLPLNPMEDLLHEYLQVSADGLIAPTGQSEPKARDFIDILKLNDPKPVAFRRRWIKAVQILRELSRIRRARISWKTTDEAVYEEFIYRFGYPEDLPDLAALRPPSGNRKNGSESKSFYSRKSTGRLQRTYFGFSRTLEL